MISDGTGGFNLVRPAGPGAVISVAHVDAP
jgi:hypothetical protein